jgi:hypothetical protein
MFLRLKCEKRGGEIVAEYARPGARVEGYINA